MQRSISRITAAALTGLAALALTAGLGMAGAAAGPAPAASYAEPRDLSGEEVRTLSASLAGELKAGAAGSYYDAATKKLVVNVVDEAGAATVRKAGAEPRMVKYTTTQLDAAGTALREKAGTPGTAWVIDPRIDKLVVTADRTVDTPRFGNLSTMAGTFGDKVETRRTDARFTPYLRGGDAILSGGARCSLGFNVLGGDGTPYFLTAGHCTNGRAVWNDASGREIGRATGSRFPGDDFGIVKYDSGVEHPSEVNLYNGSAQPVSRAADAFVGEAVQRSGSTTGVHGGTVSALNATVQYAEGTVSGLIETNVCAEPGDSGGPLFDGATALGLTSGGRGDCTAGGTTYFQPVTEPLTAYGARIG
ncbi:S1 family peptidase [Streptomyces triculaminicus]|uniref:S1 family peptidase n=1 Tax=Streptomyces triculaminicus TaxID=2816232 RepID=UPI0033F24588